MKFNPTDWKEVKANAQIQVPACLLQLRLTAPGVLFVTTEGVETLYGEGSAFRLSVPENSAYEVKLSGGKVYQRDIPVRTFADTSEKFTNIDRLPQESGTVAEVTKAVRMFKIEERATVRRIMAARAEAETLIERANALKPSAPASEPAAPPAPASAPAPAPAPEPAK